MDLYVAKVPLDSPVFVSLGMVVLDELRFPNQHTVYDVPGGSGLYATFGARLFKHSPCTTEVSCIVVAGYDLPNSLLHLLQSWGITLLVNRVADQSSTRGLLQYEDNAFGRKTFSYVTRPLRPSISQLDSRLLRAKSFHFLASPDELEDQVSMLLRLRQEQGITQRPLIVWEPAPLSCNIANLASHFNACALVDVFSPNHLELGYLVDGESLYETEFSPSAVESQAGRFLAIGIGPNREGLVLIRSGEHGVLFASSKDKANWLPAYYKDNSSDKMVDPTGAGNTFLGAFTVALQETKDPKEACLRGSVAASYALEQFGPAKLTTSWLSKELWNGSCVQSRLQDFKARIPTA